jgi:hypothetical protein
LQAYVVLLADGAVAFAFRGTSEQLADWPTNLDTLHVSLNGQKTDEDRGNVHQGELGGRCRYC